MLHHTFKSMRLLTAYDFIKVSIEKEIIKPIKSSRLNGKTPALYNAYRVLKEYVDHSDYKDELQYKLHTSLGMLYTTDTY